MPKITIAELQRKLEQAYKVIDAQQLQIQELRAQCHDVLSKKNVIPKAEYDTLIKQYEYLEQKYNAISYVSEKKKHNERGAGRKKIKVDVTEILKLREAGKSIGDIAAQLGVKYHVIWRALKDFLIKNSV